MSDYRIEAKIRNARILRALDSIGETPTSFANKHGLSVSSMCNLAAMKISPKLRDGMWRKEVMAICGAVGVMPSDLFTERQMSAFKTTRAEADVPEESIEKIASSVASEGLSFEHKELAGLIMEHMEATRPRRAKAMRMMFMEGCTLDEIGEEIGVSRERARQLAIGGARLARTYAEKRLRIHNAEEAL